ncbi:MAG: aminotransferase class V-fold PLP-dependent enzyme [Sandaracinaceae bacterium]|nr:aminotransferase class V-fold PLP-dependent enzyme [Sandaracinaceae bacterium]
MRRVYLDHHAATPLWPTVRAAIARAHDEAWGNVSSAHQEGRAARATLEQARRAVAQALSVSAVDVVLTAGGTEAVNLGVLGAAGGAAGEAADLVVITSALEHPAVAQSVEALAARGARRVVLPLHEERGRDALRELVAQPSLRSKRWIVALQAASHETGTCLDLPEIVAIAPPSALVVIDACQAVGKLPASRWARPEWLVGIAGAKIGATAGTGALHVPRGVALAARQLGGAQERGRRAGTPEVASHAGLAAACDALPSRLASMSRVAVLRDRLETALIARGGVVNGAHTERVASVTNVSFRGWRKTTLVAALDLEGLSVSAGAACSSGLEEPSRAITALHPDEPWRAESCVRASLGPETTDDDVERAIAAFERVLARTPG